MKQIDIDKIENIEQVKAVLHILVHAPLFVSIDFLKVKHGLALILGQTIMLIWKVMSLIGCHYLTHQPTMKQWLMR